MNTRVISAAPQALADEKLVDNIEALLDLDAAGALVPHGIGGLARTLFERVVERLKA